MAGGIRARKEAHIEIAASGRGSFRDNHTLLDEVTLIHQALPELSLDEIDLSIELFGRKLQAPLLVGAMTGGTNSAARINRDLSSIAAELGLGFCLGSQRAMQEDPSSSSSFKLRDTAPDLLLIGNIGVVQARELGSQACGELASQVSADAMAVHLNPAQEMMQTEGDRDFRRCTDTLENLAENLPMPLLVKETGCGISREAGQAMVRAGIRYVETGGAGGTSWVRVEAERNESHHWLGETLGEWGIPTAASLLSLSDLPLTRIAGGGLRSPLDIARAISLGAVACAVAQPVLAAYIESGPTGAKLFLSRMIEGLKVVCLLTGCRRAEDLASAPRIIGPNLERWQLFLDRHGQGAKSRT